jgi:vacuolar-type H+-ATPase catalytic subunit A/Vma1
MKEGKDVLVCIDDLKKHADACREIALISEKNTGRDAYPADIFYTHSRLLEKGCQYKSGGSITILPVMETKSGDITDYISTNIISITDGQIVLSEKLFKKGQKPAVNYGLSVSRLGGAVQRDDIKKIGSAVRRKLLSYLETADVYQLVNIESLSDELQDKLYKGQELMRLLNQRKFSPISQDRLVELFGYTVGMGESTAVKELLKYVEKSNEIDSADSLVKKSNVQKTFVKKDNPVVQENKVEEPKIVEPVKPVVEPKEEKISLDQMANDDSLEINFFQSASEVDSDFDKNKFSNTNSTPGPVVPATPVVSTPAPAPAVAPAVSTPAPVAPATPVVSTPAAPVAPVVSTPVQTAVQPVAPVQSVQEIK